MEGVDSLLVEVLRLYSYQLRRPIPFLRKINIYDRRFS